MTRRLLPLETIRGLAGFGGAQRADGYVFQPTTVDEAREVLALAREAGRRVVLRGSGRSYGDAAIAREAVVLDLCAMNQIVGWDPSTGILEAEAGATLGDVWRRCLPDGWWPPVVSGTMFPTLGGALAMNIHGKNAYRVGTLGEHVRSIDVLPTDGGEVVRLGPSDSLFHSVVSGAGLAGLIVGVRLQLKKVPSGDVRVRGVSCSGWKDQFDAFDRYREDADYMVSWIDCFARGHARGRGLFHAAWYAEGPPATLLEAHQSLPSRVLGVVPKSETWRFLKLLNRRGCMRLVNAAKHAAGRIFEHGRDGRQSLVAFSFLLDYVPGWERAYAPGGFIQVQTFVPAAEARRVFDEQIQMQQRAGLESFLGVMKRHRADEFALSHGVDGYSLALDFKVTRANRARVEALADGLNKSALAAGGRFYLAKDSVLDGADYRLSIGDGLERLHKARERFDPDGILTSAQAERLGLL
ncbi:MAG: FAD-binding oxidoreductase [Chthonomonadaceae bacterium]|nr:FAD-binding oxidoreductase [Chthonomonadaceae bacterium]